MIMKLKTTVQERTQVPRQTNKYNRSRLVRKPEPSKTKKFTILCNLTPQYFHPLGEYLIT